MVPGKRTDLFTAYWAPTQTIFHFYSGTLSLAPFPKITILDKKKREQSRQGLKHKTPTTTCPIADKKEKEEGEGTTIWKLTPSTFSAVCWEKL